MNLVAELLTGWKWEDALGKGLGEAFHIINQETRTIIENPVTKAILETLVVSPQSHIILISKDGRETIISLSAAPIRDDVGKIKGVVFVFREVIEHKREETEFLKPQKLESRMTNEFKKAHIRLMIVTPSSVVRQGYARCLNLKNI